MHISYKKKQWKVESTKEGGKTHRPVIHVRVSHFIGIHFVNIIRSTNPFRLKVLQYSFIKTKP
jgi:hypothetical protein